VFKRQSNKALQNCDMLWHLLLAAKSTGRANWAHPHYSRRHGSEGYEAG